MVVYVNDIVISGDDYDGIMGLKQYLFHHFKVKHLGKLWYFHCIDVAHSKVTFSAYQIKYALNILEETNILNL